MHQDITAEDILRALLNKQQKASPGLSYDIAARTSSRPREVYKDIKTERCNDISREVRVDSDGEKVSARPTIDPEAIASQSTVLDSVSTSLGQKAFVSNITPARTSSRYSGISVQHHQTQKGIKLAITLQTPELAELGGCQYATAELKRYDRLREVRSRVDDSEEFNQYLAATLEGLKDTRDPNICIGRLHHRGKRSKWIYDTLAIGFLDNNCVRRVMLYLEGTEYVIELDKELSTRQQQHYQSVGIHGALTTGTRAPRLQDLEIKRFGEE